MATGKHLENCLTAYRLRRLLVRMTPAQKVAELQAGLRDLEAGASATGRFDLSAIELLILKAELKRVVEPAPLDILIGFGSSNTAPVGIMVTH